MSKDQMQNEIRYQLSKELLMRMLFRNLITEEEYNQMNNLNLQTFQPTKAKLYEKNSRCVTEKQVSFA
nr:SHOCT domain-containing protein [uncultured Anaerotignum sp.]